jgi:hypothetical protein
MQADSRDIEPYWIDEPDWLCTIEFLPTDAVARGIGAEAIGCLFGYAQLTDTRMLALIGDADAQAYELLASMIASIGVSLTRRQRPNFTVAIRLS